MGRCCQESRNTPVAATPGQRMPQGLCMPGLTSYTLPGVKWRFYRTPAPYLPPPAPGLPSASNSPDIGLILVVLAGEVAR